MKIEGDLNETNDNVKSSEQESFLGMDTEEWLNHRSDMYDHFALEEFKAKPIKVYSLKQAITD